MIRRERFFLALTLLIPLGFFALAELAARVFWPVGALPLFVEAPVGAGRWLVANPGVATRWFPHERRPPAPTPELMLREKPANGFRVFVLGESAAQGFPYPRSGAFSRAVAPALERALPARKVEVINLGIAATNSFSMLDLVDEILAQQPDAVLYYGGHNEYYGAFGAGSSVRVPGSPALARAYLRAQRLRSLRLANLWLARVRASRDGPRDEADDASFMGAVARDRAIVRGGAVFRRGVEQYEGNLRRIVRRFRAAGVPVFLASVASNERDQPPFASPANGEAEREFAAAVALLAAADPAAARARFAAARDLDVIRFRAPAAFADVARRVAAGEGAVYVPVAEAIAARSDAGSPGAEHFLEHVHFNRRGSWLVAQQFLAAFGHAAHAGVVAAIGPLTLQAADTTPDAADPRGLTPFDDRIVEHRLAALMARWPFVAADAQGDYFGTSRPRDRTDSLAFQVAAGALAWELAKLEVGRAFANAAAWDSALAEFAGVMRDSPAFPTPWRMAGETALRAGRLGAADSLLAEAHRLDPASVQLALLRAQVASTERRWDDAARILRAVVSRSPADPEALYRLSMASALAGDTTGAREAALRLRRVARGNPTYERWVRLLTGAP